MIKLVVGLMLILVSSSIMAEWAIMIDGDSIYSDLTDIKTVYSDFSSIKTVYSDLSDYRNKNSLERTMSLKEGFLVKMSSLYEYKNTQYVAFQKPYRSAIVTHEFDRKEKEFRLLGKTMYEDVMGEYWVYPAKRIDYPLSWTKVQAGSHIEALYKEACITRINGIEPH